MHATEMVHSTQPSAIALDGIHVATLNNTQLQIRRISSLDVVRTINVPSSTQTRFLCLRWSPIMKGAGASNRFFISDEDTIRVWDLQDPDWCAVIDNGTGGMGKIANVEFGSDDSEILVFSNFGSKVTVWSLWTAKSVEIKDPKFSRKGYGRSATGRNGVFAILTRPGAQDTVSLHVPGTYGLIKSFAPQTVDAQGLQWSPDGRWLAIWDAASSGYKVLIYTADGNLFRTYQGDCFDDELKGLGVKALEWSPNGDFLIVAGFQKTLTLLGTRTFSPAVHLSHPNTIKPTRTQIWQEHFASGERTYSRIVQQITPPAAPISVDDSASKIGISILGFSADGSYLATKEDSMPTTVFVWDLADLKCCAVLLQHSVVKKLTWHSTDPNSLLIQCIQGESTLYTWNALEAGPRVLNMPSITLSGKAEAQWIPRQSHKNSSIMFGDHRGFAIAYPDGRDGALSPYMEASEDSSQCQDLNSDNDAVYAALNHDEDDDRHHKTPHVRKETVDTARVFPDDTFDYRRGAKVF